MSSQGRKETNPHYSILGLVFFIVFFLAARIFTTLSPNTAIIVEGGIRIHHFWFGLALLAIGGWLGIIHQNMRVDQLAAVLYGAGGGLVADEVGLLLTFGDYWTGMTYTIVITFIILASLVILLRMYPGAIRALSRRLSRSRLALYFAIFLAVVSVAFFLETNNIIVLSVTSVLVIVACVVILVYFIQRFRSKR